MSLASPLARPRATGTPRLAVSGVSVSFGGLRALGGVSLEVHPGEIVSLIGPNGAGKTTLFNVVSGFLAPSAGSVLIDGVDATRWPAVERAHRGLARTFQRMELFEELTVLENLIVSRELRRPLRLWRGAVSGDGFDAGSVTDAEEILAVLGVHRLRHRRVDELSTGIRRLVELGRVLMLDASLLLLDEPSSGLDQVETGRFKDVVRDLLAAAPDLAVLLVEHDMSVALELADHVYVLDFGELILEGPPGEVRSRSEFHAAYLGSESRR